MTAAEARTKLGNRFSAVKRNEVTGVVAIDFGWVAAAVKIGMDQSKSCEWDQIEAAVQAQMIFGHGGDADLCQISDRREEGHPAEGKILIHIFLAYVGFPN